jgi:hypothetical protein
MKKSILIVLAFFALTSVFAQQSLNDYKYVIVPNKFEFLNEADEYRINSLTKFLFEKYNFEAIMEDEVFPSDYAKNNCLGLKADVLKDSNLFKTKLTVQLKNCKNEVIYTSAEGESRDKNYKVAYNEALRLAFKSFEDENYNYVPKNVAVENEVVAVEAKQKEIERLKAEVKTLKADSKKIETLEEKPEAVVVEEIAEVEKVVEVEVEKAAKKDVSPKPTVNNNALNAVLVPGSINSYYIKNVKGEVVYTLLHYGQQDLYIVKGKDAIVTKINNVWVIKQYVENDLQVKALDLKF